MENLLLPSKIEFEAGDRPNVGTMIVTPCYHGYGTTLGNSLRRVLLSSLPGAAVEAFKIRGIQHEFSTIEGVKEDVVEIMLNLKQLAVKVYSDDPVVLNLTKKGPGVITAKDIAPDANVEIINKDLMIANITANRTVEMEIVVGRGRGYRTVEEKDRKNYDLGTIVSDSIYSPIKDVGYHVEYTRVGDITNFEKLVLRIETNGTITPREAILQSTQILMDHYAIILDGATQAVEAEVKNSEEEVVETTEEETEKKEKKMKKEDKGEKKVKKTTKKK